MARGDSWGDWALGAAVRFGLLGVGLIFAGLAWFSWDFGDPPSWTHFLPSEPALVVDSRSPASPRRSRSGRLRANRLF